MAQIHCPNCGSTAQVRRVNEVILTVDKRIIKIHYECGCGCKFRNEYAYKGTYKDGGKNHV